MKYQLVLQLPASSAEDYDEMIEVEEVITGNPDNLGRVDGDDAGSGEMNIFILQFSEGGFRSNRPDAGHRRRHARFESRLSGDWPG